MVSGWESLPAAVKTRDLTARTNRLPSMIMEMQGTIENYREQLPAVGIGVTLTYGNRKAVAEQEWGAGIVAVWKGSPAEHVGLLPGDLVMRINGKPVCGESSTILFQKDGHNTEIEDKWKPVDACIQNAADFLRATSAKEALVEVERDRKPLIFKVGKAQFGQSMKAFIAERTPAWNKQFDDASREITGLREEIQNAGDNGDKLYACLERYFNLFAESQIPINELDVRMEGEQNLMKW